MKIISAQSVSALEKPFILDVRTPSEHQSLHIAGAVLQPLHQLNPARVQELAAGQPCYVLCRSGQRARQAAEKLEASGLKHVEVIDGGILAWKEAGLPVVEGKETMSIERQARLTAGLFVLAGALLAHFVNPAWIWLSAFFGAGLAFAALTNSCALGLLLARMPWNNRSVGASAESGEKCCG
jgi:rhodanese-related sulfurtransferase